MTYTLDNIPRAGTICVTGHRPKTMRWGYDLDSPKWRALQETLERVVEATGASDAWTGMALGVDTVFARAVLAKRRAGFPVRLHAAVPFRGQESKWLPASVGEYRAILSEADETVVVSQGGYAGWKMTERDKFMVERSDLVVAVWNGSPSGTGRCKAYAESLGKDVLVVDPALF